MLNNNLLQFDNATSAQFSPSRNLDNHPAANRVRPRNDGGVVRPGRPPRHRQTKPVTAEAVLKSFNTWAFKREQPSDPETILQTVAHAVARAEPISFVLYWGKGPRTRIDSHDIECLDHLIAMAERVREGYEPGATFALIFTDTHATLNGYSAHEMNTYFADIEAAASQRGFDTCRLSDLTRAAGETEIAAAAAEGLTEDMLVRLSASAMKWYRGEHSPRDGALKYYRMNMVEKRAVERAFPNAIFATFNGSKFRCLFPSQMPIFYMYSLRRGISVKPWFLPADALRP